MKKGIYLLMLCAFFSCSQDNIDLVQNDITNKNPVLKAGGDGKYDLLGYGCNITEDLYTGKFRVIDNTKLLNTISYAINEDGTQSRDEIITSGTTAESYLKNVTKTKSISLGGTISATSSAKASISKKFTDERSYASNYAFANADKFIQKKAITYTVKSETLRKYISPEFSDALVNFNANDIITRFGTHVYSNVKLGGKLSVIYRASTKTVNTEKIKTVEAGASGVFKKVFNVDIKYSKQEQEKAFSETKEFSFIISTKGGNSSIPLTNQIINGLEMITTVNTSDWEKSVGTGVGQSISLIDFNPGTLIPLWEFVEPGTKQDALKAAIIKYITDNELKDIPAIPEIPDMIESVGYLFPGQFIQSKNKRYVLMLQYDGNLVLCKDGKLPNIWHSNTWKAGNGCHLILQNDGNLVIYNAQGKAQWGSSTSKVGYGTTLILQNDGNLVLYDRSGNARWSTDTWRN